MFVCFFVPCSLVGAFVLCLRLAPMFVCLCTWCRLLVVRLYVYSFVSSSVSPSAFFFCLPRVYVSPMVSSCAYCLLGDLLACSCRL